MQEHDIHPPQIKPSAHASTGTVIDPVCGMTVDPAKATARVEREGATVFFCSDHCRKKFEADPGKYLHAAQSTAKPTAPLVSLGGLPSPPSRAGDSALEYTCPMHPEVRQSKPGACPK